jgi:D-3-phosphoglycerate dehydrogenase
VKELVLAGLLIAARNLVPAVRFVEGLRGTSGDLNAVVEDNKKHYAGIELPERTLGILGLGRVGSLLADAAIKLGMHVLGYDPEITVDAAWSLPSQVRKAHSIEEVLKSSEFISVHVPLLPATRHLINEERLAITRHGAVLLNFARDEVVDAEAVGRALDAKRLKYYVCDFPNAGLLRHPNVIALPHLGASTREAEDNCAVMVANQVRDYLEHGNIRNAVNFPDVVMARESPFRIGIANANVPNMLGQISTAVAHAGLNIHNMLNKSRQDMAYTLVDVDSAVPQGVLADLAAIKGVLTVRYLPV